MTRKTETIPHLDASIKRWKTRLRRAINKLGELEKKRKRLAAKPPAVPASTLVAAVKGHIKRQTERSKQAYDAAWQAALPPDTGIPDFLRRDAAVPESCPDSLIKKVDDVIADQIREEQADTKKRKAAGRIAKMKAKKAGDLKKMPLSGKAALDHIDNG
jgi:hypothetical protein